MNIRNYKAKLMLSEYSSVNSNTLEGNVSSMVSKAGASKFTLVRLVYIVVMI